MSSEYFREPKGTKPIIAICYDFDKTLTHTDMQAQGFIQEVAGPVDEFWNKSNSLAEENEMDQNLAYMYTMKIKSIDKVPFTKKTLAEYAANIKFFDGVPTWFDRINQYGEDKGVIVEHYVISSGLKEMIEGSLLGRKGVFKKVYASSFYYDVNNVAVWPAQVVNFTNKTQFLYRIKKGTLNINDPAVNDLFSDNEVRIPFNNMIYIGDSDTDIPCMKLINEKGGYSIGVYDKNKQKVYKMMQDGRINYFVPADYSEWSELDNLVKNVIEKVSISYELEQLSLKNKNEFFAYDITRDELTKMKWNLIVKLSNSGNFKSTHTIVGEMNSLESWSYEEIEAISNIALTNNQVHLILSDDDVRFFLKKVLSYCKNENPSEPIRKLKKELEEIENKDR